MSAPYSPIPGPGGSPRSRCWPRRYWSGEAQGQSAVQRRLAGGRSAGVGWVTDCRTGRGCGTLRGMSAAVALPGGVREQTARSVVRAAAFLRAGQLAGWLWVPVVYGIASLPPVVLISYLLAMVWTAVLFI